MTKMTDVLERMRQLEAGHETRAWTEVRVSDITAMRLEIERLLDYKAAWCGKSDAQETLQAARTLANEQAEDEGLWFEATTITEAHLQQALRALTAAIEGE